MLCEENAGFGKKNSKNKPKNKKYVATLECLPLQHIAY